MFGKDRCEMKDFSEDSKKIKYLEDALRRRDEDFTRLAQQANGFSMAYSEEVGKRLLLENKVRALEEQLRGVIKDDEEPKKEMPEEDCEE